LLGFGILKEFQKQSTKKRDSDVISFYKNIKEESEEENLLNDLIEGLDFGSIKFKKRYAVVTPGLAANMSNTRELQRSRLSTSPAQFYGQKWKSKKSAPLKNKTMDLYNQIIHKWPWNDGLEIHDSPVLPVVHGTSADIGWKIATEGFASLSSLDSGFYGKGIYFSSSARYTLPYCFPKPRPTILICLTIPGNPYPVTEHRRTKNSFEGKPLCAGHQSHYVIVQRQGYPFTEEDHKQSKTDYDELVIDQEAQIVPMFLLQLAREGLTDILNDFTRVIPQAEQSHKVNEELLLLI